MLKNQITQAIKYSSFKILKFQNKGSVQIIKILKIINDPGTPWKMDTG